MAGRQYIDTTCAVCGKELKHVYCTTKYCLECRVIQKAKKPPKPPVEKKCRNCGVIMRGVARNRKYCTDCSKKLFAYDSNGINKEEKKNAVCSICGEPIHGYKYGPKRCDKCKEKNLDKKSAKREYLIEMQEKVELRRIRKRVLNTDFSNSLSAGVTYGEYIAQKDAHIYQSLGC